MKPTVDRRRPGLLARFSRPLALAALLLTTAPGRADSLISTTNFTYTGGTQTYTVPSGTQYVIVKAWGAGGGTGVLTPGGGGGFIVVRYNASASQTWTVYVGGSGSGYLSGGWPHGGSA